MQMNDDLLTNIRELFYEYGNKCACEAHECRGDYWYTEMKVTETRFEKALEDLKYEIKNLQSVRARGTDETGEVGTKRKGKEATPERTSYDMGHCV
jgi:hypothetical protein